MKPQNKHQVRVFSLAEALPKITKTQIAWAFKHCLKHLAYRNKTKTACLDCGHVWARGTEVGTCKCPSCKTTLTIEDTRCKVHAQREFLAIVDVVDGMQLTRFFELRSTHKAGEKANIWQWEVAQHWIDNNHKNKVDIVARNRGGMGWNQDGFSGYLEIRDRRQMNRKYDLYPTKVYPKFNVLPEYKRNGFNGDFGGVTPYELFSNLLTDSRAETLLKANQSALLQAQVSHRHSDVHRYWNSVKICIRNNYTVQDAGMWLDYLAILAYFEKDLRNPVYVCPADLKAEHDRYVIKRNIEEKRRNLELKKAKAERDEAAYQKAKSAFFGIMFKKENLTVKVLESVKEFIAESEAHRHCVFGSGYYSKADSLVFSASVDGKLMETIEVSLSKMKVVQARGFRNEPSPYHNEIIGLMKKNMPLIRKTYKSTRNQIAA